MAVRLTPAYIRPQRPDLHSPADRRRKARARVDYGNKAARPRCPYCPLRMKREYLDSHETQYHAKAIRRQAQRALREAGSTWQDALRIARPLYQKRAPDPVERIVKAVTA